MQKFKEILGDFLYYDGMHLDDTRGGLDVCYHHRETSMIIYITKI